MLKRFLTSFILALITVSAFAQTPYDAFAPEQSVKIMNELEHKGYLLANSDTTATVRYIAIDWSRSSYTLIGKDGINISTGLLSELDKKFLSMDQHCEDYYSTSPYAYCLGNPISYVDPNGMDVAILLVDSNPFGHLALLIQNEEGKWFYYSINGVESSSGASDRNDVGIEGNWNSPEEFFWMTNRKSVDNDVKSNQNLNLYNYTDAFVISTTSEQDRVISQTFSDYANKEYDPLINNCATIVQNSLIAGGLERVGETITFPASPQFGGFGISYKTVLTRPHEAFNSIRSAYKGIYFSK